MDTSKFTAAPAQADTLVLKPGNPVFGEDGVRATVVSLAGGQVPTVLVRTDRGESARLSMALVYHDAEKGYCAAVPLGRLPSATDAYDSDDDVPLIGGSAHVTDTGPVVLLATFGNRESAIRARGDLLGAGFPERDVVLRASASGETDPVRAAWSEVLVVSYVLRVDAAGKERIDTAMAILEASGAAVQLRNAGSVPDPVPHDFRSDSP